MATTEQETQKGAYDMEHALGDAMKLLKGEFGDVDQQAAVSLATFMYTVHEREEFIHRDTQGGRRPYETETA